MIAVQVTKASLLTSLCLVLLAGPGTVVAADSASAPSLESWADKNLPVSAGLEVWFDASRQNAARAASKQPPLANEQTLDTWSDASGHKRDLQQKAVPAQPTFVSRGYSAIRFNGRDQSLRAAAADASFKETTIFLVAAPFSNRGGFLGLMALNQKEKEDYRSGLTIDQSWLATMRFETLNVEGAGFGGAVNLSKTAFDFGTVQRLCVTSAIGAGGTKLYLNGQLQGQRDRALSLLHMDQLTVGARFYSDGVKPQVRGYFDGDVMEVLIFNRVLADAERAAVEKYLADKHGNQRKVAMPLRSRPGKPLVSLANPPAVQVFVPGFSARQLPVKLTNINNLLYRPDGKLLALAYDGNIYLLSDSDGDGLEDKVELFWENNGRLRAPIGMALTPPGYKHGDGVFVACKGKCSLIVDTNGDAKADKEIIVAEGWHELPHGVDALGVAVDPRDQSIYFGLGTINFTNPYLVERGSDAKYSLGNERGAILHVSPDFKNREIFATGIRFPVGIRFNRAGDLFCTDQEGATWLPNGNPFDELLHIQKGRHYGFPPRHPKHLPKVIDEPSVWDYAPQHQCACGLNFNEPVNGGPVFGPEWWQSDVLVAGYSRGKLFRTQLVKTAVGYVAKNDMLASLDMLPVDACVSPKGDLVVAVHGGGPDWGNGPGGTGKLYKISYTGAELPQPVLVWPQGPHEVWVTFDRLLSLEHAKALAGKATLEYGKYVSAGDRFEKQRPGYQAVMDQLDTPRYELPVLSVHITKDRHSLILSTAAHPEAVNYALTLPGLGRTASSGPNNHEIAQVPQTDLRYDLTGVQAEWHSADEKQTWVGWLPHLDLTVARKLTEPSAVHQELWNLCKTPGNLTLRTKLNLWHMLRPAVQPGSKIDYEWPSEIVELKLVAPSKMHAIISPPEGKVAELNGREGTFSVKPKVDAPIPCELTLATGGEMDLAVSYNTNEDPRSRPLPIQRLLLPWASITKENGPLLAREIPELQGGDWLLGRKVFFSELAGCFKCHKVNGQGGEIGPDLSNLPQRDYASVLRDITQPSYAINPDYISYVVILRDGRQVTGSVRTLIDWLLVSDTNAEVTSIRRDQVEEMNPSPVSIMPADIDKRLGRQRMKDLLTFLLSQAPSMPDYGPETPPPARSLKEVQQILAGAPQPPPKTRPLHLVLVSGKKDHGPGEHDYPAWQKVWSKLLSMADDVKVTTAQDWPSASDLKTANVLVFFQQGQWNPLRAKDIDAFLARGGGLVYIHYAVDGGTDSPGFAQRIGLAWRGGQSKFRHGPLDLGFETGTKHPISRNFDKVHFHDESYWQLTGDLKRISLLASGKEDGKAQPLFWALEPSKGRVFVSIPGHYSWTFDDPLFRILLLRGIAWTAREPVDRFNDLVMPGARVKD
jgi:putative heme-binding domain-containing protein